jgi:2-polyprenyl-3-methyl-5-hydroxy-6-metoxy-1,4-benzoquinol methylase
MKIGPAFRRLLPARLERTVAGLYRAVFVDLRRVARTLAPHLPTNARVLDVGGGDGELLNTLFALRPDLHVTMVDVSASVGKFVQPQHHAKIKLLPRTFIENHLADSAGRYDAAVVSDVLHHIPVSLRASFLANVQKALGPQGRLFVKDIEPGHAISKLSLFSDKYVSGDKQVALISRDELTRLATSILPSHTSTELGLLAQNSPNYLVRFDFK